MFVLAELFVKICQIMILTVYLPEFQYFFGSVVRATWAFCKSRAYLESFFINMKCDLSRIVESKYAHKKLLTYRTQLEENEG